MEYEYINLTLQEFHEKYTCIKNPFDKLIGWDGCLFLPNGNQTGFVLEKEEANIWTVVESEDGHLYLLSGFHFYIQRFHLITKEAVPEHIDYYIKLDRKKFL